MPIKRGPGPLLPAALFLCLAAMPAAGRDVQVSITNFAFAPATVTISAGDTVTFVNDDDTVHSVIADAGTFRSDGLDTGDRAVFTFARAGSFGYHCGLHPFMPGAIVVK